MCLAIPGKVIRLLDDPPELATVEVSGVVRNVNVGLIDPVQPGDWVLIHVGFAMSRIDEEEARSSLEFLERLGDVWREELEALEESRIE